MSLANAEVMKTRLTNVSRAHTRMLVLTVGVSANGETGESLLALADRCQAAASGVDGVARATAKLNAIVDGRARIVVESVLDTPQALGPTRPLLIAALTDAAAGAASRARCRLRPTATAPAGRSSGRSGSMHVRDDPIERRPGAILGLHDVTEGTRCGAHGSVGAHRADAGGEGAGREVTALDGRR